MRTAFTIAALILAAACTDSVSPESLIVLSADPDTIAVHVESDGRDTWIAFDLPVTVHNRGRGPAYMATLCMPALQLATDTGWTHAWSPSCSAERDHPSIIGPGETARLTYSVRASNSERRIEYDWRVPTYAGTFRVLVDFSVESWSRAGTAARTDRDWVRAASGPFEIVARD